MGSSDNGDDHSSIDITANFGVGFSQHFSASIADSFFSKIGFFAAETIRRYQERRKVQTGC
jgi:hypothetical protein